MDVFLGALGIIAGIVIIILIIKFIIFLFTNFLISRILCTVLSLIALFMGFSITGSSDPGETVMADVIVTTFAWLFYIGPVVFDVHWTGSWDISETWSGYSVTPRMTGGFFGNLIGAGIVVFICYGMLAMDIPALFFVLPIGILLLNAIAFFNAFRR